MKKLVVLRALMGAPVGLLISTLITIGISAAIGDGQFHPVVPSLAQRCGELNAVALQTVVVLLYGAVFSGASVIWEVEKWSLLRQTVTHLLVVSLCTLPVALGLHWMEAGVWGMVRYFGIFFGIYACIWLSITLSIRGRLRRINRSL